MSALSFEQITDSRFDKDPLSLLEERVKAIVDKLSSIDSICVSHGEIYRIDWEEREDEPAHIQYRAKFSVKKTTRKVTWDDVYGLINEVHPVRYRFV